MRRAVLLASLATLAVPAAAPAEITVQAHRGGPYEEGRPVAPENTMSAFRRAADAGYVLEIDVKLSRDRVPVVIHDDTLDRTTTCTGPVSARTAAQLAACRVDVLGVPGSGLPTAPARDPAPVPRLAEVLAFARERSARLNVEIKNLPTDGDFDAGASYAATVLDAVDAARIPRSLVVIQSFWPANLDVAEQRGFTTSLLTLPEMNAPAPEASKARGYDWVSPSFPGDATFVSRAHTLGLQVVPYTLDRPEDVEAAVRAAVDEVISNDPAMAARVAARTAPREPAMPRPPSPAACRAARASRTLEPIESLDPRPGAPRVFAIQFKQDVRHVTSYAAFRTKIECLVREWVVPRMARDRPNVVAFDEDVGLATIATGTRGRAARAIFTDPSRSPACNGSTGVPCGAFGALLAVGAAYGRETAAYRARFPGLSPVSGTFVAATDTFARGFMQTFSDIARRYGVYILGSNNQAPFRESTEPAEIAQFADPDLPERPASVFVATRPEVYNEAFLWAPRDVRRGGPAPLRNVVASNKKVPLTPIEELLELSPGPRSGPDAIANVAPYTVPGTQARISFATSLPAFVYGPPTGEPCADVARSYMRCLDRLGANVVMQDEANPGKWAAYTAKDSPDRGAWQTLSWMTSTWRAVSDPTVRFAYNVTPHLVGNLADLPFDGQTAITQRGLDTGPGCHYVGASRHVAGTDPATFAIGGESLAVPPFAGPKREFVALAPWVRDDGPREELMRTSDALAAEGDGPLENDYLETAVVADLPFPPRARRSCATAAASTATSRPARAKRLRLTVRPRRLRAGRRTRLRVYVRTWSGPRARPVRGALVRFGDRRVRTGARGRATLVLRPRRPGARSVRVTRRGLRPARVTVRVVRR